MGSPARSRSTLPGSRLLPIRAWMIATTRAERLISILPQGLTEGGANAVHVLVGHRGEERQAQAAGIVSLCVGKVPLGGAEMLLVPRLQMHRDVMNLATDVAGGQSLEHLAAPGRASPDLGHHQVIGRLLAGS